MSKAFTTEAVFRLQLVAALPPPDQYVCLFCPLLHSKARACGMCLAHPMYYYARSHIHATMTRLFSDDSAGSYHLLQHCCSSLSHTAVTYFGILKHQVESVLFKHSSSTNHRLKKHICFL